MWRKWIREFFLMTRSEQRAMLLLSGLLLVSLAARVVSGHLPVPRHPGTEQLIGEARALLAAAEEAGRPEIIELNSADSADLLPLPGIGPVFAGRIIRFRELLGGYHSTEQLLEVYGMPVETYRMIESLVEVDTSGIIRMDLNRAGFRALLRHPYLEYPDVKALVRYRDVTGGYQSAREIRHHQLLPDSTLEKVLPYLGVDR